MTKLWRLIGALMLIGGLAMSGCNNSSESLSFKEPKEPQAWAILADQPAYAVITDSNWTKYYPTRPSQADFKEKFYIVATWGPKQNPGYRISITSINQTGSSLQVRLKLDEPDPKMAYAQVIVRPTAVAEVGIEELKQRGLLTLEFLDQKGSTLARIDTEI